MGAKATSGIFPNLKKREVAFDKAPTQSFIKSLKIDTNTTEGVKGIENVRNINLDSEDISKNNAASNSGINGNTSQKPDNGSKKENSKSTEKFESKRAKNKANAINRNSDKSKFLALKHEAKKVVTKKQLKEFLAKHQEFEISASLQNVHRPGTAEFKENKSIILGSLTRCQRLTMKALKKMKMNSDNFILVHSLTAIGTMVTTTGKVVKTRYAKLHYGKHGAHLVPVLTNLKNWRKIK